MLKAAQQALHSLANPDKAVFLQRFFKTGPGEYGEGDCFLGITVPEIRKLVKKHQALSHQDVIRLLKSKWHEQRLFALLIWVEHFQKGSAEEQARIVEDYLAHSEWINNWDLVDCSAHKIVGPYYFGKSKSVQKQLAKSELLWDRRIAVVSTYYEIRHQEFGLILGLAKTLLKDSEDLMHKAVGWMLREMGKQDQSVLEVFLEEHVTQMPRTMLRYAIEKLPEKKRKAYLNK